MAVTEDYTRKLSFYVLLGLLALVVLLKLATPLLTVFFGVFFLTRFQRIGQRWLSVTLFLFFVFLIFYGFILFVRESVKTLPGVAETAIPKIIETTQKYNLELPFTDMEGLKTLAVKSIHEELAGLARFANFATHEFVFLIIGLVVAISIFLNPLMDLKTGTYEIPHNLYSRLCNALSARFQLLFQSFSVVMGAQLVISAINTFFTSIFVLGFQLPYAHLIIGVTFLCGLLPIIGNIISNTIIFIIAATISLPKAAFALLFLIVLHKMEYFLNSKIIGGRIQNPMWLTLLSLLVGEQVMGIAGMILAPVLLNYLKLECSQVPVIANEK